MFVEGLGRGGEIGEKFGTVKKDRIQTGCWDSVYSDRDQTGRG